jgi:hypothetical protein
MGLIPAHSLFAPALMSTPLICRKPPRKMREKTPLFRTQVFQLRTGALRAATLALFTYPQIRAKSLHQHIGAHILFTPRLSLLKKEKKQGTKQQTGTGTPLTRNLSLLKRKKKQGTKQQTGTGTPLTQRPFLWRRKKAKKRTMP